MLLICNNQKQNHQYTNRPDSNDNDNDFEQGASVPGIKNATPTLSLDKRLYNYTRGYVMAY